ncbi:MAG TPA: ribosome small subunit-dependent GTPase A [Fimbriimonadaceae bacterium]|nr:ribosome small subunit-dependent GTPase A [Fimbriimonadaceae bacterium]HRJ96813.1 ribosome small subunit-dependent GTPase A [Fimbriimonadaceae bacterium]
MNPKLKSILDVRLAGLDANERNKLYKRAQKVRKETLRRSSRCARYEDDEGASIRRRSAESLVEIVLKLLEEEQKPQPDVQAATDLRCGQVVWLSAGRCRVKAKDAQEASVECTVAPDLVRRQQSDLAVGDFVWFGRREDVLQVVVVEPRLTKLARPDPANRHLERVVAANVDVVVVVVSVVEPPLHPRLIDRFVIAIERGGAEVLLCVNKVDRLDTLPKQESELAKLEPYDAMGLSIVLCSAETGFGLDDLRRRLTGRLCAFVGHSGVGKSSLVNALAPELDLAVRAVSPGYGRGRHTTVASTLHELPCGLRVIDTPGVRSFGLGKLDPEDIPGYFPEFEPYIAHCRFRDCRHMHEPVCGVREAVADGRLSRMRYETYCRMLNEEAG